LHASRAPGECTSVPRIPTTDCARGAHQTPKPRTAGVSASEHGRAQRTIGELQARVDELEQELVSARTLDITPEAEKIRRLEIENAGLRSEIEELKAEVDRLRALVQELEARISAP